MRSLKNLKLACLLLTATFGLSSALAQNTTGTIVGHVTDTTGASVASAQVIVTNVGTSQSRSVTTTANGDFTVPLLGPGSYKVEVSEAGFTKVTTSGIVLQVGQTVRADSVMKVGGVNESVSISASTVTLDTDSAAVGQLVSEKQITELPLNGRYFTDLIFLAPGAVQTTGEQSNRIESGNAISVGGGRSSSNGYTLDGTSIMDVKFDTPAFNPSLDMVQEFKLQTKTYSAAYGYSVNQITMSSKSGTNTVHGSVFEYLRNNYMDARNYFQSPTQPVAPLRQNQFGYSLGGPVVLPKIYNGRNRTFFFANYEGQRIATRVTQQNNVPTADQLNGIFTFPVTNPATGQPFPMANGVTTLPGGSISRLGKLLQSKPSFFFPAPNQTGAFNWGGSLPEPTSLNQQNYRIDQSFGPSNSVFFRATKSDLSQTVPSGLEAVTDTFNIQSARNYTVVYTHIFTPNLVNQFRFGYLEALAKTVPFPITAADTTALALVNGFTTANNGYPSISLPTYPGVANASISYAGTGAAINTPSISNQPLEDLSDSVSWTRGKHTINFGYGMQWLQFDAKNDSNLTGALSFTGQFSGNQISDLLLGDASTVGASIPGPLSNVQTGDSVHLHLRTYAPYIQDDWKVTPTLTVNAGLRWEFHQTPFETQNQLGWWNPNVAGGGLTVANPKVASVYGNNIYVYNGKRGPGPSPRAAFAPRFGFAYRVNDSDKWVVRGGYGLFYDTVGLTEFQGSMTFYPYSDSINITQTTNPGPISTDTLFPPVPFGPVQKTTLQNSLFQFLQPEYKVPYVQDWSLGVQRQVTPTTILDVDYEGNKGTRLFQRIDTNQPTQCNAAHNCDPLHQTAPTINARRPYPNFGEVLDEEFTGWSNYNALDVKLERHSTDLTMVTSYSYSKSMDVKSATAAVGGDAGGAFGVQNAHDIPADYARSGFDVGQRLAFSAVASLPVGRGKRFLGNSSRLTDTFLGGWQANAIYQLQKGFPFSIAATDIGSVNEGRSNRANLVGNPYPSGFQKSIKQWFNKAAFANPAPGDFGNSGRNMLRGPRLDLLNLSLFKDFSLFDRLRMETRLEAFNALNHPQFSFPSQNVTSATFGVISSTARDNRELQVAVRFTF